MNQKPNQNIALIPWPTFRLFAGQQVSESSLSLLLPLRSVALAWSLWEQSEGRLKGSTYSAGELNFGSGAGQFMEFDVIHENRFMRTSCTAPAPFSGGTGGPEI